VTLGFESTLAMNILSEEQALDRQLLLPTGGLLSGLTPEFIGMLQLRGAFAEYNQRAIVNPGDPIDYVFCVVKGQVKVSRLKDFEKVHLVTLGPGQWFGEISLFSGTQSRQELMAEGEVIAWTIPHDILRHLFFEDPAGVQLLYNFGVLLAQELSRTNTHADPVFGGP
jgi:CRP-like cAMP-binding protein